MTKVRKSFLVLPLLFTVFVTAVMFSACGKTAELTLSENLADKASTVVNNIVQKRIIIFRICRNNFIIHIYYETKPSE